MAYDPATDSVPTDSVPTDSATADDPPALPADRHTGCPFDPPAALIALSDRPVRLRYADGHVGRLVTGHAAARAVLADPRFSSRYELLHLPLAMEGAPGELPPAPVGDIIGLDAPEHTRYRRLLAGRFTVRRMRQLTGRVERFTADCLDAMEQAGPTADLVEAFARPVPTLVICELLGVPYADRGRFLGLVEVIFDQVADAGARDEAYAGLLRYVGELVLGKRAEPTDDLLSDLAAPGPGRLDIRRRATGHLSFGHGPHQCLGQQLARVDMTVALPALFARFPSLRLAVPPGEVPLRERSSIYGVVSLPVAWGEE
ncbi:cytochrome P450 [Streptomyces sp. NPDC017520]|uniref:cytochrome P450 n=1 Tax=Streptomyces sp. NPDC017520 TaxID=3364998 RepID=UPI0037927ABC